jgi:hypothetical protein
MSASSQPEQGTATLGDDVTANEETTVEAVDETQQIPLSESRRDPDAASVVTPTATAAPAAAPATTAEKQKRAAYVEAESGDVARETLESTGYKLIDEFGAEEDKDDAASVAVTAYVFQHEKSGSLKLLFSRGNQHYLFNQTNVGPLFAGQTSGVTFKSRNPKLTEPAEAPAASEAPATDEVKELVTEPISE